MSNQFDYPIRCKSVEDRNKLKELSTLVRGILKVDNYNAVVKSLEAMVYSKIKFK